MKLGFATLKAQRRAQFVIVMDLGSTMLENKTMTMTNFGSLSSWCRKLMRKKENTMMRSRAPHCRGVWICNFKSMMMSPTCCCHGRGLYSVGKQNHDDDELRFVIIMVRKAQVKRRKHDNKEEFRYVILEA